MQHAKSLLRHAGSFVAVHRLFVAACGLLSSCGMRAPEHVGSVEAYGILVPQPEIKLTFPELEGGFFTTGPPGKSPLITLKNRFLKIFYVHDFLGFARKQFTPNLSWIWQQTFYHLSHFLWFGNL